MQAELTDLGAQIGALLFTPQELEQHRRLGNWRTTQVKDLVYIMYIDGAGCVHEFEVFACGGHGLAIGRAGSSGGSFQHIAEWMTNQLNQPTASGGP